MKNKLSCLAVIAVTAAITLMTPESNALILYGSQDPDYNTTPPTGEYANSGWDLEGLWLAGLATPVSPHYFIASHHVGGSVGGQFRFRNVLYTIIDTVDYREADLTLWKVDGTFPDYARIYQGTNYTGATAMVFGRGSIATNAVYSVAPKTGEYGLRGWYVGSIDLRVRWGISQSLTRSEFAPYQILMSFNQYSGPNQCIAELGDSSGGIYIKQDNVWKLAGLINATDGLYSLTQDGATFQAALFDLRGIYYPDLRGGMASDGTWENDGNPIPSYSYGVSLYDYYDWISTNAGIVTVEDVQVVNHHLTFNITTASTASVSVQSSANLTDWQTLGSATHLSGSLFQFTDTNAISSSPRFYRAASN